TPVAPGPGMAVTSAVISRSVAGVAGRERSCRARVVELACALRASGPTHYTPHVRLAPSVVTLVRHYTRDSGRQVAGGLAVRRRLSRRRRLVELVTQTLERALTARL